MAHSMDEGAVSTPEARRYRLSILTCSASHFCDYDTHKGKLSSTPLEVSCRSSSLISGGLCFASEVPRTAIGQDTGASVLEVIGSRQ